MRTFLREPLLHFLLIGASLFLVFDYRNSTTEVTSQKSIHVTQADIDNMRYNFANTWQRLPTEQELSRLIEEKVRDEITYQEALNLGLDNDDLYIKRRLRMKLESIYIDLAANDAPSIQAQQDYLKRHQKAFYIEGQLSFSQVFFSPSHNIEALNQLSSTVLTTLNQAGAELNIDELGDATLLDRRQSMMSLVTLRNQFGQAFADEVDRLEPGKWFGPVRSLYGYHLVRVEQKIPGYLPTLEDVKVSVEQGLISERRQQLLDAEYQLLRDQYSVVIDSPAPAPSTSQGAAR